MLDWGRSQWEGTGWAPNAKPVQRSYLGWGERPEQCGQVTDHDFVAGVDGATRLDLIKVPPDFDHDGLHLSRSAEVGQRDVSPGKRRICSALPRLRGECLACPDSSL